MSRTEPAQARPVAQPHEHVVGTTTSRTTSGLMLGEVTPPHPPLADWVLAMGGKTMISSPVEAVRGPHIERLFLPTEDMKRRDSPSKNWQQALSPGRCR
ncbi:MAG TPA: hypothetical protein VN764_04235 [Polyangiaceae bacterium]|nr:hypothetical protein [Polyangiaceae bacterium]